MIGQCAPSNCAVCLGVVLFDKARSRVFVVRGSAIVDAREFAVAADAPGTGSIRLRSGRLVCTPECVWSRAGATARLAAALHAAYRFQALLIAGPRHCQIMLRQAWLTEPTACPVGTLKLAVGVGESGLLSATLAKEPRLAGRALLAMPQHSPARDCSTEASFTDLPLSAPAVQNPRPRTPVLAAGSALLHGDHLLLMPV